MPETYSIEEIIPLEDEALKERREKLFGKAEADKLAQNRFGIALSGGGIRSATINLGFLKTLNKFDVLKKADYLSTVSGGGYCGSYIQATLKNEGSYEKLFTKEQVDYMRKRGEYLFPGKGWTKVWNQIVLAVGYLASLVMSLFSPIIPFLIVAVTYLFFFYGDSIVEWWEGTPLAEAPKPESDPVGEVLKYSAYALGGLILLNYLSNLLYKFNLFISSKFHRVQAGLVIAATILVAAISVFLFLKTAHLPSAELLLFYCFIMVVLIFAGFFTNPNATSFHRFYRQQLAEAFLHFSGDFKNVPLKNLFQNKSEKQADYLAPYPLVNTCLNLQSTVKDQSYEGTKTSDFFLLSPKFCGSKLVGYVETADANSGYDRMTFPAAITVSAAAINPGMGNYSNKIVAILTTLLNARLGYWTWNPSRVKESVPVVWWPFYFFFELFSKIGTDKKMLNISDGGHIENLAVYELLRRKCRLILAVDAGEDPFFTFADLENLTVRARNELGVDIRFREDQVPEDIIRPKPSHGYSQKRYAVADLFTIWEEILVEDDNGQIVNDSSGKPVEALVNYFYKKGSDDIDFDVKIKCKDSALDLDALKKMVAKRIFKKVKFEKEHLKFGALVYVKSSVTAPPGKPLIFKDEDLKYGTYKYKIYHPNFPHEPTSDQFFDEVQWEAYYQLGQYIGAEVLGIPDFVKYQEGEKSGFPLTIEQLIDRFDKAGYSFFQTEDEAKTRGGKSKGAGGDGEVPVTVMPEEEMPKEVNYSM